jgi:hypothetical protein
MAANESKAKLRTSAGTSAYCAGKSPENVVHRQIMTLDIDFAHLDFGTTSQCIDNAAMIHSAQA